MEFVAIGALLAIGGFTYIYMYRKQVYKQVDKLEQWKIDLMNRPVPEELAKVKSLNMMGETEQLFEKWREEWDDIVTVQLPNVEEMLFDIEEATMKYRFMKAKGLARQTEEQLKTIEGRVQAILFELQELIGSEERNRREAEQLREQHRQLKKAILTNRHALGHAEQAIERRMNELQQQFQEFEQLTNEGNYLAAREVILRIEKDLQTLSHYVEMIPVLLSDVQVDVPSQLENLLDGYREMLEKEYVLDHLPIEQEVENIRKKAENVMNLIGSIHVEEAEKQLGHIHEHIDTLYDLLEKEVYARQFVQKEMANIEETLYKLEEETKETKDETLYVQQSYHLSPSDLEKYRQIEKQVHQLIKRFMLIQTKAIEERLAHSFIREELEEILAQMTTVKERHERFRESLYALRKDELAAREKLSEMKRQLSDVLRLIKKSRLPGVPESYTLQMNEARDSLTRVSMALDGKPLNMEAVHHALDEATALVEKVCERAKEMIEQAQLAEKVIQYGNRYRRSSRAVKEGLEEAEQLFRAYEYEVALHKAVAVVEQVEAGAFERIQSFLKENE